VNGGLGDVRPGEQGDADCDGEEEDEGAGQNLVVFDPGTDSVENPARLKIMRGLAGLV
jgi:hypothetical protein